MYEEKNGCVGLILKIIFYTSVSVYFLYHVVGGEYGIYSYGHVNKIFVRENNALNKKKDEVERKKNKIERLKSDNIDLDLLDEELKKNVGIVDKNEIILFSEDIKNM